MMYYRCKCGKAKAWGSMHPDDCNGCSECNTTLEVDPSLHKPVAPHEWVTWYDEHTGKPYKKCNKCYAKAPAEEGI